MRSSEGWIAWSKSAELNVKLPADERATFAQDEVIAEMAPALLRMRDGPRRGIHLFDGTHPIAFAAKDSHGFWRSSGETFYEHWGLRFLAESPPHPGLEL